jgi:hypothetical protein
MACHFSAYGTGLSNLPPPTAACSMLILNDRTPIRGHDPEEILCQLKKQNPDRVLLDFQRQAVAEARQLTNLLVRELPCPVGVSHWYGEGLDCPVFLPPIPPDEPVEAYLRPWQGREIWLEVSLEGRTYSVTEQGSTASPLLHPNPGGFSDEDLHCHYRIRHHDDRVSFQIYRTPQDLQELLAHAKNHGVTTAVGLYQEMGSCCPPDFPGAT